MSAVTTNIVIAALGGEGGGVLANWIENVANNEDWLAQTTSIAGVAQRTGATIYYIELFPRYAVKDKPPVMSTFPTQGDIDIAIASEISEAGRMVQRGFVCKNRTTLIGSDHRVYGITEKIDLGDGTIDIDTIKQIALNNSKKFVQYDMAEIARQYNTVISATLFGALAGSKALPFSKESFVQVISDSKKSVDNNLAAFNASYYKAIAPMISVQTAKPNQVQATELASLAFPQASTSEGEKLLDRVKNVFPAICHPIVAAAIIKLIDYQDYQYAHQYLDTLTEIVALDNKKNNFQLSCETARALALFMCFEDTARVAQIKTRQSREQKIRDEVKSDPDQILFTTEFFRPQLEELCQCLPPRLAQRIIDSPLCNKIAQPLTQGRRVRSNAIPAFLLLRGLSLGRKWRRKSWVYDHEFKVINNWLGQIKQTVERDYQAALEVVECAYIVKGYGATRRRGRQQIILLLEILANQAIDADAIAQYRKAALSDDDSTAFNQLLARTETP